MNNNPLYGLIVKGKKIITNKLNNPVIYSGKAVNMIKANQQGNIMIDDGTYQSTLYDEYNP